MITIEQTLAEMETQGGSLTFDGKSLSIVKTIDLATATTSAEADALSEIYVKIKSAILMQSTQLKKQNKGFK
jgi:hypothetical protein